MESSDNEDNNVVTKNGKPEVSSARNRFSGALNIAERIVDKFAGDDFPSSPLKRLQGLDSPFPSPTKSPRGVRRRRKKPVPLNTAFHHTFVMKLFDRSVDLAQFPHDTSLYPVCRAWMINEPHNTNMAPRGRTPTPTPEEDQPDQATEGTEDNSTTTATAADENDDEKDVYKLPDPEPIELNGFGEEESMRIAKIDPLPIQKNFEVMENADDAPDTTMLLNGHMNRWLHVRKAWRRAAYENEQRFADSVKVLTEMYEK